METSKGQHQDIFDFNQELGSTGKRESIISLGIATLPTGSNGSSGSLFTSRDSEDNILSKWSQQGVTDYTLLNNLVTMSPGVSPLAQSRGLNEDPASMVMKVYALLNLGNMPITVSKPTQIDAVIEERDSVVMYESTQGEVATSNGTNSTPGTSIPVDRMPVVTMVPVSTTTVDWYSLNLKDAAIINSARTLGADNELSRTDFLSIFQTIQKTANIDSNELADLKTLSSVSTAPFKLRDDVRFLANKVAQGTTLDMKAADFDSALVGKWFLGTVAPTASFTSKNSKTGISNTTVFNYTAIKGNLFGSTGSAQIADINQGSFGDCSFLAALGSTFAPQSNDATQSVSKAIDNMIIDNNDNTYSVKFYDKGNAEYVTVDRRVATYASNEAGHKGMIYGAHPKTSYNPNKATSGVWAPLVERAYAQWREDKTGKSGYDAIGNGDWIGNPLGYVTGKTVTSYNSSKTTFSLIQSALAKGQAIETGSKLSNDYVVGNHAYSVTNAYTDATGERIVVRNPWGVDGVKVGSGDKKDGFVDLSFSDFKSYLGGVSIA